MCDRSLDSFVDAFLRPFTVPPGERPRDTPRRSHSTSASLQRAHGSAPSQWILCRRQRSQAMLARNDVFPFLCWSRCLLRTSLLETVSSESLNSKGLDSMHQDPAWRPTFCRIFARKPRRRMVYDCCAFENAGPGALCAGRPYRNLVASRTVRPWWAKAADVG